MNNGDGMLAHRNEEEGEGDKHHVVDDDAVEAGQVLSCFEKAALESGEAACGEGKGRAVERHADIDRGSEEGLENPPVSGYHDGKQELIKDVVEVAPVSNGEIEEKVQYGHWSPCPMLAIVG